MSWGEAWHGLDGRSKARETTKQRSGTMEQHYIEPERVYPFYDGAIKNILERFEQVGYGAIFQHNELKQWMGIMPPETIDEAEKERIDYMTGMVKVRDALIYDYNICLGSKPGLGYQILTPNEQVREGADIHIRKSKRALSKATVTLANVDESELDMETRQLQLSKIGRVAFIKSAFRKRKIPAVDCRNMIE